MTLKQQEGLHWMTSPQSKSKRYWSVTSTDASSAAKDLLRMFIRLLQLAEKEGDQQMVAFCREVLRVYEEHGVNDHIHWE